MLKLGRMLLKHLLPSWFSCAMLW